MNRGIVLLLRGVLPAPTVGAVTAGRLRPLAVVPTDGGPQAVRGSYRIHQRGYLVPLGGRYAAGSVSEDAQGALLVTQGIEQDAAGLFPVAAAAADLLRIVAHSKGQSGVDDQPDVGDVHAKAKGRGRHHDGEFP